MFSYYLFLKEIVYLAVEIISIIQKSVLGEILDSIFFCPEVSVSIIPYHIFVEKCN